ncbi:hypothetical protein KC221_30550, partial [Mycobacterium tuberculosis]|nr:hypothetical protein [Mycobacterium tuberculosis]
ALGHITKDPNGTAYGRFEFIDDRDVMMQTWADYLDALKQGKDTSSFKHGTNIDPYQHFMQRAPGNVKGARGHDMVEA